MYETLSQQKERRQERKRRRSFGKDTIVVCACGCETQIQWQPRYKLIGWPSTINHHTTKAMRVWQSKRQHGRKSWRFGLTKYTSSSVMAHSLAVTGRRIATHPYLAIAGAKHRETSRVKKIERKEKTMNKLKLANRLTWWGMLVFWGMAVFFLGALYALIPLEYIPQWARQLIALVPFWGAFLAMMVGFVIKKRLAKRSEV